MTIKNKLSNKNFIKIIMEENKMDYKRLQMMMAEKMYYDDMGHGTCLNYAHLSEKEKRFYMSRAETDLRNVLYKEMLNIFDLYGELVPFEELYRIIEKRAYGENRDKETNNDLTKKKKIIIFSSKLNENQVEEKLINLDDTAARTIGFNTETNTFFIEFDELLEKEKVIKVLKKIIDEMGKKNDE